MGRFVVVMSMVLIWTQIADAKWELWGNWTGADLKEVCDQADPNDTLSGCLAYVLGTADGIGLMKGNSGNAIKVCEVPHHVTSMEWILSIREYFDKHPTAPCSPSPVLVPRIVNSALVHILRLI
jgi:Rap1a immunity proteins